MQSFAAYLPKRSLISVRRQDVDSYGIQGFLVGLSDSLVALEYVYDFEVDGLLVLRRSDITEVRRTATDEFQERLLKQEGIRPGTQQPAPLALDGWRCVIDQVAECHPYMILERELGPSPEFSIGRRIRTTPAQVEFQHFSGAAKWSAKPERLKFSHITSLQVNSRYLRFYQKHFERQAGKPG